MFNGILVTSDPQLKSECEDIIQAIGEIDLQLVNSLYELDLGQSYLNQLFIIITELNAGHLPIIQEVQSHSPELPILFYNHSLNLSSLTDIGDATMIRLIVGTSRQESLQRMVERMKKTYWRILPYPQFGIDFDALSPRIKKALKYIENAKIRDCRIPQIAAYLNISAGYFSQEFKRETGLSFRTFMQKVINYYENIIFSRVNLPAKSISEILGYSELSSFSRSFKKRKGISPTKYKKMVNL